jgi:hypothetical protein
MYDCRCDERHKSPYKQNPVQTKPGDGPVPVTPTGTDARFFWMKTHRYRTSVTGLLLDVCVCHGFYYDEVGNGPHRRGHRVTGVARSGLTGYYFYQKKTGVVRCPVAPPLENPRSGLPGGHPRSTGTGNRDRTRWGFWTFFFFKVGFFLKVGGHRLVSLVVSDEEEEPELASGDGDVDGDGDGCLDEVIIVEKSTVGGSAGSISVHLSERNEDDSVWSSHDGIKPSTTFNKMKPDDMAEIKLAIRSTLKRFVLPVFHLNADVWTIEGSHSPANSDDFKNKQKV